MRELGQGSIGIYRSGWVRFGNSPAVVNVLVTSLKRVIQDPLDSTFPVKKRAVSKCALLPPAAPFKAAEARFNFKAHGKATTDLPAGLHQKVLALGL